jgi:hypothetical protein
VRPSYFSLDFLLLLLETPPSSLLYGLELQFLIQHALLRKRPMHQEINFSFLMEITFLEKA